MSRDTDRIVKHVTLHAPLERVWRAITDSQEFGRWFGVEFTGPFVAGQTLAGRIVSTTVDAEVARMQEPYIGLPYSFVVDRIEPMRFFSFRWHPSAVDTAEDYSREPMTLVFFQLIEVVGGTELTIVETGFERIPLERRAKAFAGNEAGWEAQASLITKYLARTP